MRRCSCTRVSSTQMMPNGSDSSSSSFFCGDCHIDIIREIPTDLIEVLGHGSSLGRTVVCQRGERRREYRDSLYFSETLETTAHKYSHAILALAHGLAFNALRKAIAGSFNDTATLCEK